MSWVTVGSLCTGDVLRMPSSDPCARPQVPRVVLSSSDLGPNAIGVHAYRLWLRRWDDDGFEVRDWTNGMQVSLVVRASIRHLRIPDVGDRVRWRTSYVDGSERTFHDRRGDVVARYLHSNEMIPYLQVRPHDGAPIVTSFAAFMESLDDQHIPASIASIVERHEDERAA